MSSGQPKQLRLPALIGFTCLTGYLAWNFYWIRQLRIPPSLMKGLFSLPAPTTGMTRSWLALLDGNVGDSFLWNPLTLPITCLYFLTLATLAHAFLKKKPLRIGPLLTWSWLTLLPLAWVVKLAMEPARW